MSAKEESMFKQGVITLLGSITLKPKFYPDGTFPRLADLHNAVVFIQANFSGPSGLSLRNLASSLVKLDPAPDLIVLNTELLNFEGFKSEYGPIPSSGGWGEAFWVRDGLVWASDGGYHTSDGISVLQRRISGISDVKSETSHRFQKSRMDIY